MLKVYMFQLFSVYHLFLHTDSIFLIVLSYKF